MHFGLRLLENGQFSGEAIGQFVHVNISIYIYLDTSSALPCLTDVSRSLLLCELFQLSRHINFEWALLRHFGERTRQFLTCIGGLKEGRKDQDAKT